MSDIVEKLRAFDSYDEIDKVNIVLTAADHIEQIRAIIEQDNVEPVAISQDSIELLAMELAGEEHDDIHELIWEGGAIPEPWGEVWQKYEEDAKAILERAAKYLPMRYDPPKDSTELVEKDNVSQSAYHGAMEDKYEWKKRALEAEKKLRVYDQRIVDIGVIAMTPIVKDSTKPASKDWISVEDRLPDDCNQYLVFIHKINGDKYITSSTLNPAHTGFYVEFNDDGSEPIEFVTHWMPMPAAPTTPKG